MLGFSSRPAPRPAPPVSQTVVRWFLAATVVLCGLGWLGHRSIALLEGDAQQVANSHEFIGLVHDTLSQVKDVQSGQRGYLLTDDREYLVPYHAALPLIQRNLEQLKEAAAGDTELLSAVKEWETLIGERVAVALGILETYREQGGEAAIAELRGGKGHSKMKEVRETAAKIEALQRDHLAVRIAAADRSTRMTAAAALGGLVVCFAIQCAVFWVVHREALRREQTEAALQQSHQELETSLFDLRKITTESAVVTTMADFLQTCQSPKEAYAIIGRNIPRLLPGVSGAIGIISNSRNLVEIVFQFGDQPHFSGDFHPDDCWGLRRGRMHHVADTEGCEPLCSHISHMPPGYLCLPMVAHGETLGVLSISSSRAGGLTQDEQKAARTIAEQASLALANLRLQDALRVQSIRDPLTGLFNRRYLEASLERELIRAKRQQQSVAVVMIDVDHFKRFNDTHGHEGGDALLSQFGKLLNQTVRGEDIPCRYGGEEFCLILPGATLEAAVQKAETLREAVKKMVIRYRQQPLSAVTISMGVAVYPEHNEAGDAILQTADVALYRAKKSGRDRVIAAGNDSHSPSAPFPSPAPQASDLDGVLLAVMSPQNSHTCSAPACHAPT